MYDRIVVGITNRSTARAAAEHALGLARSTGATVHLVYAIAEGEGTEVDDARRHAAGLVGSLALSHSQAIETHVVAGRPDVAILDVAQRVRADLIVIGNQGLAKRGRLTAQAPARVVTGAPCSVLVVDTSAARVQQ